MCAGLFPIALSAIIKPACLTICDFFEESSLNLNWRILVFIHPLKMLIRTLHFIFLISSVLFSTSINWMLPVHTESKNVLIPTAKSFLPVPSKVALYTVVLNVGTMPLIGTIIIEKLTLNSLNWHSVPVFRYFFLLILKAYFYHIKISFYIKRHFYQNTGTVIFWSTYKTSTFLFPSVSLPEPL